MTWAMVGWIIIGLAAILLAVLTWIVKPRELALRRQDFVRHLNRSRTATLEQGRRQEVVLGHALWSRAYPGLGLSGLANYDALLDAETLADGRETVSATAGILAVFARQIIRGRYESGFSEQLLYSEIQPVVYGPTTFSFNSGLMSDLKMQDYGTLVILGDFGPESAISVKNIHDQRGQAFRRLVRWHRKPPICSMCRISSWAKRSSWPRLCWTRSPRTWRLLWLRIGCGLA